MTTERSVQIDKMRTLLACSKKWAALMSGLPLVALASVPPLDLESFTDGELVDVALWILTDFAAMPIKLDLYLQAVRLRAGWR